MIVDNDVVAAISNSGESDEITAIIPALKRKDITLVCITARPDSTMARHADIHITASVSQEACPLGLAPTTSTTAVMALGDALAVVLLRARAFTPDDFALIHPVAASANACFCALPTLCTKAAFRPPSDSARP